MKTPVAAPGKAPASDSAGPSPAHSPDLRDCGHGKAGGETEGKSQISGSSVRNREGLRSRLQTAEGTGSKWGTSSLHLAPSRGQQKSHSPALRSGR